MADSSDNSRSSGGVQTSRGGVANGVGSGEKGGIGATRGTVYSQTKVGVGLGVFRNSSGTGNVVHPLLDKPQTAQKMNVSRFGVPKIGRRLLGQGWGWAWGRWGKGDAGHGSGTSSRCIGVRHTSYGTEGSSSSNSLHPGGKSNGEGRGASRLHSSSSSSSATAAGVLPEPASSSSGTRSRTLTATAAVSPSESALQPYGSTATAGFLASYVLATPGKYRVLMAPVKDVLYQYSTMVPVPLQHTAAGALQQLLSSKVEDAEELQTASGVVEAWLDWGRMAEGGASGVVFQLQCDSCSLVLDEVVVVGSQGAMAASECVILGTGGGRNSSSSGKSFVHALVRFATDKLDVAVLLLQYSSCNATANSSSGAVLAFRDLEPSLLAPLAVTIPSNATTSMPSAAPLEPLDSASLESPPEGSGPTSSDSSADVPPFVAGMLCDIVSMGSSSRGSNTVGDTTGSLDDGVGGSGGGLVKSRWFVRLSCEGGVCLGDGDDSSTAAEDDDSGTGGNADLMGAWATWFRSWSRSFSPDPQLVPAVPGEGAGGAGGAGGDAAKEGKGAADSGTGGAVGNGSGTGDASAGLTKGEQTQGVNGTGTSAAGGGGNTTLGTEQLAVMIPGADAAAAIGQTKGAEEDEPAATGPGFLYDLKELAPKFMQGAAAGSDRDGTGNDGGEFLYDVTCWGQWNGTFQSNLSIGTLPASGAFAYAALGGVRLMTVGLERGYMPNNAMRYELAKIAAAGVGGSSQQLYWESQVEEVRGAVAVGTGELVSAYRLNATAVSGGGERGDFHRMLVLRWKGVRAGVKLGVWDGGRPWRVGRGQLVVPRVQAEAAAEEVEVWV